MNFSDFPEVAGLRIGLNAVDWKLLVLFGGLDLLCLPSCNMVTGLNFSDFPEAGFCIRLNVAVWELLVPFGGSPSFSLEDVFECRLSTGVGW